MVIFIPGEIILPRVTCLNFNNCLGKISDVTKYPQGQSYYKALDTEGNTFEWVGDWYDALYYRNGPAQDPLGPDNGKQRSVRSSSYKSKVDQVPASTRFFSFPTDHRRDLGFRCVVLDPTFFAPTCQSIGSFGSSGGTLQPDCPKVNIGLTPVCQQGIVTVTITDDHPNDPNAHVTIQGSCTPPVFQGSFPQIYTCSSSTTVTISSKCTYPSSQPAQCAPHYNLNPKTGFCEWDGTRNKGWTMFAWTNLRSCTYVLYIPTKRWTKLSSVPRGHSLGFCPSCKLGLCAEWAGSKPT